MWLFIAVSPGARGWYPDGYLSSCSAHPIHSFTRGKPAHPRENHRDATRRTHGCGSAPRPVLPSGRSRHQTVTTLPPTGHPALGVSLRVIVEDAITMRGATQKPIPFRKGKRQAATVVVRPVARIIPAEAIDIEGETVIRIADRRPVAPSCAA